jgi:hypothetical protein
VQGGIFVFSQPLNWDLTGEIMVGLWKRRKVKTEPKKGVSVFQDHRRDWHSLHGISTVHLMVPTTNVGMIILYRD